MQHEKRVALVVGNGAYDNTPSLPNPPNDAAALATSLRRLDFNVLDGRDLKLSDFAGRIRDFGRALRQAHVALFYYAGHGLQVGSQNYVVPVDATLEHEADVQLELIAVQTILAQMEVGNRTSLVILDACRNNPLARNLARAMGTRSVAIGEGLGRIESGIGTFIAFATSPNKVALDGDRGSNSPFTAALLRHIETPGLTITEIMVRVRRDVIAATEKMREGPQVPWDSSSLTDTFYFKRPATSGPQQPGPPDPAVTTDPAERDWERFQIAETEHVATIEAYVAQYQASDPLWAARARQRLEVVQALIADRAEARRREREARERAEAKARVRAEAEVRRRQEEDDRKAGIIRVLVGTGGSKVEERRIAPGFGESFKDFAEGPEMVIVPAGSFMMGTTDEEIAALTKDHGDYFRQEAPRHRVTIPEPFAIGKYTVTRGQFANFVSATGHKMEAGAGIWTGSERKLDTAKSGRDPGFKQDDQHPVVCVNWDDAKAFASWLSRKTGQEYRLTTEAEWEYAARARTMGPFWWGRSISTDDANYDGNYTFGGSKGKYRRMTEPVACFKANPWGLYQVHGNVWEWCEDEWQDSYEGKPEMLKETGGAWTPDTGVRVLRGGSWAYPAEGLRSASRQGAAPFGRDNHFGFRVARSLIL